ncbi:uncharacterized protein LOC114673140 isoform X4 [Macaca mulatta]
MSPFAPQRRRRRCPRHRHCLERPHRAGGQRAVTRSRLIPRLGRRHSPQKPWAPAVYQDARRTAWFRERAPKATCRRPAPGRVPSACGNRPLHPARDAELGENLVQRGLNARAPPRGGDVNRLKFINTVKFYCISGPQDLYPGGGAGGQADSLATSDFPAGHVATRTLASGRGRAGAWTGPRPLAPHLPMAVHGRHRRRPETAAFKAGGLDPVP